MAATAAMKSTMGSVKSILPTDFPSLGVPWLMEAMTALYGRAGVADRIPPVANVVISNVPGPTVPLYMAGAKMLTNYPTSIVVHGMALNITVQTYDQSLDFGLIALCARRLPRVDGRRLRAPDDRGAAFDRACQAVPAPRQLVEAAPPRRRPCKKRGSRKTRHGRRRRPLATPEAAPRRRHGRRAAPPPREGGPQLLSRRRHRCA